ncbi:hypothetical protein K504DRAFT_465072 [Pleomassaria siparia CBS 279.74]|uniref:Uncharacterized protein n=1 Tax=Pleomassaria siparia CBS 279.74 TaxID=1314801 RepID=A0A6G1KFI0_9PLEO|nr:hypothetical protein K504DRAFT_465072 [Pleomassaria siparia CBS 279.74]
MSLLAEVSDTPKEILPTAKNPAIIYNHNNDIYQIPDTNSKTGSSDANKAVVMKRKAAEDAIIEPTCAPKRVRTQAFPPKKIRPATVAEAVGKKSRFFEDTNYDVRSIIYDHMLSDSFSTAPWKGFILSGKVAQAEFLEFARYKTKHHLMAVKKEFMKQTGLDITIPKIPTHEEIPKDITITLPVAVLEKDMFRYLHPLLELQLHKITFFIKGNAASVRAIPIPSVHDTHDSRRVLFTKLHNHKYPWLIKIEDLFQDLKSSLILDPSPVATKTIAIAWDFYEGSTKRKNPRTTNELNGHRSNFSLEDQLYFTWREQGAHQTNKVESTKPVRFPSRYEVMNRNRLIGEHGYVHRSRWVNVRSEHMRTLDTSVTGAYIRSAGIGRRIVLKNR